MRIYGLVCVFRHSCTHSLRSCVCVSVHLRTLASLVYVCVSADLLLLASLVCVRRMVESSLVFDGVSSINTPCFYDPVVPIPPESAESIPDNSLVAPSAIPGNDQRNLDLLAAMMAKQPFPLANACTVNPPGFVCDQGMPGQVVRCVPRMDHSDLNQLAARVLPLTMSNGKMDNPASADARFPIFPSKYIAAFSRCCQQTGSNVSKFSDPSDIVPPMCGVDELVTKTKMLPKQYHDVDAFDLGFRRNQNQLAQLLQTNQQLTSQAETRPLIRDSVWEHEAGQIEPGLAAKFAIRSMSFPALFLQRRSIYDDFL